LRADGALEVFRGQWLPVRLVEDAVQFEVRHAQDGG